MTADEITSVPGTMCPPTQLATAVKWLRTFLGDREVATREVVDAAAVAHIAVRTLDRALQTLGCCTVGYQRVTRTAPCGCSAHNNVHIHHIIHREHGGTKDMLNLISLCEAHHLAHHAGTLVISRSSDDIVFRREGRNRFTRATREVETKTALKARGFDTTRVQDIMARTITHVGETDLSAGQWLAIALRYAEPRG